MFRLCPETAAVPTIMTFYRVIEELMPFLTLVMGFVALGGPGGLGGCGRGFFFYSLVPTPFFVELSRGRWKGFATVSGLVEDRFVRSELRTDELLGARPSDLSIDGGDPFFLLERMLLL